MFVFDLEAQAHGVDERTYYNTFVLFSLNTGAKQMQTQTQTRTLYIYIYIYMHVRIERYVYAVISFWMYPASPPPMCVEFLKSHAGQHHFIGLEQSHSSVFVCVFSPFVDSL